MDISTEKIAEMVKKALLEINVKEEAKEESGADAELEAFVLAKIEERAAAKKAKDFATADAIRDELLSAL